MIPVDSDGGRPDDGPAHDGQVDGGRAHDGGQAGLGDQIFRITRRLRRVAGARMEPLGLSPHHARALQVIDRGAGARLSVLAERLRVAPRSATDVVDALEARGLVVRAPDLDDRRAVLVQLTDAGRAMLADVARIRQALHEEAFAVLTEQERHQLGALLAKLERADPVDTRCAHGNEEHGRAHRAPVAGDSSPARPD